jgi:hypothetical protein
VHVRPPAARLDAEPSPAQHPDSQIVTPIQLWGSVRCVHGTTPKRSMAESAQNESVHRDPLYRRVISPSFFRMQEMKYIQSICDRCAS